MQYATRKTHHHGASASPERSQALVAGQPDTCPSPRRTATRPPTQTGEPTQPGSAGLQAPARPGSSSSTAGPPSELGSLALSLAPSSNPPRPGSPARVRPGPGTGRPLIGA
ncbi:hypothetical protein CDD83_2186 [Cordyceps sp. RAO-2017]|nr:hypothetical protein CDD83_2186 [Cordyceps sp. RAO-2017]